MTRGLAAASEPTPSSDNGRPAGRLFFSTGVNGAAISGQLFFVHIFSWHASPRHYFSYVVMAETKGGRGGKNE
jgi:hypothetical protein